MRAPSLVICAVILALGPGCKSMGGVMSGLGKVAGGVARAVPAVATGVVKAAPAIARGVAQVGGAVARGVVSATPTALRVSQAVIETAAATLPDVEFVIPVEGAPLMGSSDPCLICPEDFECGVCAGYAGYACVVSPAGALGRCESSAPPDAEPAP